MVLKLIDREIPCVLLMVMIHHEFQNSHLQNPQVEPKKRDFLKKPPYPNDFGILNHLSTQTKGF